MYEALGGCQFVNRHVLLLNLGIIRITVEELLGREWLFKTILFCCIAISQR